MKVLVCGIKGMAGHIVYQHLKDCGHEVHGTARSHGADFMIDVENTVSTLHFFRTHANKYDFIVNCIGLLVKPCIDNPDSAAIVNAWFPQMLASVTKGTNTRVIHISTDCVFDGSTGGYTEDSLTTERNAYGKSKAFGEIVNNKDITMRTSIIGHELKADGSGLFNWVYQNSPQEIQGWENAIWTGITTNQLAKCIATYIDNPVATGIYHVVNGDTINKFELVSLINEVYGLNKVIERTRGLKDIDKSLINTRTEIDFGVPSYRTMIEEMHEYSLSK